MTPLKIRTKGQKEMGECKTFSWTEGYVEKNWKSEKPSPHHKWEQGGGGFGGSTPLKRKLKFPKTDFDYHSEFLGGHNFFLGGHQPSPRC